jgi:hypothetical protein
VSADSAQLRVGVLECGLSRLASGLKLVPVQGLD